MYGRISALEITVTESQLFAAFKEAGLLDEDDDYPGDALDELGSPEQSYNDDSYSYYVNKKGELIVTREVTERVEIGTDLIEAHYRGSYLAHLELGEHEQPALCSMQKYGEWRKDDGQAEGLFKFAYVDAESTLEFVKRDEHLQSVLTQAENELMMLRTQLQECRLLLEQARDERNEAREERDAMSDTVASSNDEIGRLAGQLQDASAEHQENRALRQRVFQLEAGGEQIDNYVRGVDRGDWSPDIALTHIAELLVDVPGPWTPQDDEG